MRFGRTAKILWGVSTLIVLGIGLYVVPPYLARMRSRNEAITFSKQMSPGRDADIQELFRIADQKSLSDDEFQRLLGYLRLMQPGRTNGQEWKSDQSIGASASGLCNHLKDPLPSKQVDGLIAFCEEVMQKDQRNEDWELAATSCVNFARRRKLPIAAKIKAFYEKDPRSHVAMVAQEIRT